MKNRIVRLASLTGAAFLIFHWELCLCQPRFQKEEL